MKSLLTTIIIGLFTLIVYGQPPCGSSPAAGNTCINATPICDLNGYCGNTSTSTYSEDGWGSPGPPLGCGPLGFSACPGTGVYAGFCGSIENNSFLSFTASATSVSIDVWVNNCSGTDGVQIMIFSTANCADDITSYYCSQVTPTGATATPISANGLTIGETYYIMVDGFGGEVCDYTFSVDNSGSGVLVPVQVSPSSTTVCVGETVDLVASEGDGTYNWDTSPDLSTTSGPNVTVTPPSTPGTYTYTVNSASGNPNCPSSETATATITVEACGGCSVTANNDGPFCTGSNLTTNLTATTTPGATYSWTGPNSFSSNDQNPTNVSIPSTPGNYDFTVEVNDNGDICTSTTTVVVNDTPNADAGTSQTITCLLSEVTLNGSSTSTDVGYSWTGPNIVSGGSTLTPSVDQAGQYTLTVTNQTTGCSNESIVEVLEDIDVPNIDAGGDLFIPCDANVVQANGSSTTANAEFSWTGPGIASGANTSNPTIDGAGTYVLTVTDPSNGCTNTESIEVEVAEVITDATITVNPTICSNDGGSIEINDVVGGTVPYSYFIDNSGPFSDTLFDNLSTGNYDIEIQDANGCNYILSDIEIIGYPGIENVLYSITPADCDDNTGAIYITEVIGGLAPYEYTYNGMTIQDSVLMNLNEGVYSILIQDDNDCEYTINPIVPLNEVSEDLYVPNVLTPNGDNKNDEWFVKGDCIQDFECVILNRWGNKVFESNDILKPWNGTNLSGGNVSEGVYFYKINFISTDGKEDELHGFIHLTK